MYEYDFSGEYLASNSEYDLPGVFPEDEGGYNYDFSEVEGEYDFSGYEFPEIEGQYDISGAYPEGEGSYSYEFPDLESQYDFSSGGENPFTGGVSSDNGSGIPFSGGSEGSSNPFASGGIPFAGGENPFGGNPMGGGMGGFGA